MNLWIVDESFKIPAGEADREARSSYRFMRNGHILGFAPHMH